MSDFDTLRASLLHQDPPALHRYPSLVRSRCLTSSVPPQIRPEKVAGPKDAFEWSFHTDTAGEALKPTSPLFPRGLAAAEATAESPPWDIDFNKAAARGGVWLALGLYQPRRAEVFRLVSTARKYDDGTLADALACTASSFRRGVLGLARCAGDTLYRKGNDEDLLPCENTQQYTSLLRRSHRYISAPPGVRAGYRSRPVPKTQ
ncbi:hypothetical protein EDB86DRAFT_2837305 [Lactarius hatsudake]|nr:hypothetical protein EDB86DRAFT_2837305 [Lactarius hatsudake]